MARSFLVVITILISIGVIGYYKQLDKERPPDTSERDIKNSKLEVFTDTRNKVSFNYPSNVGVNFDKKNNTIASLEIIEQECPAKSGAFGCTWFVRIYGPYPNQEQKSLNEWVAQRYVYDEYTSTITRIANYNALKIEIPSSYNQSKSYYVQRENDIIRISTGVFGNEEHKEEYQKIIDEILLSLSLR